MLISKLSVRDIGEVQTKLEKKLEKATCLQEAAQIFVEDIYEIFSESIVLLRLFVTITKGELPVRIQSFVEKLAKNADLNLEESSYVLTLLGSTGENPDWNKIENSKAHQGIPLATSDFVNSIPMMSALLEQLGFKLGWIRGEAEIVTEKIGMISGTFYVKEAGTAKDSKGRLIIAAQDFVKFYKVETVFGVGGGYLVADKFLTTICFLREPIERKIAFLFQGLANLFKFKTQKFVKDKVKIFKV